ncbi:MAG: hypothetical protein IJ419_09825 [Agathobacter sp.]|nr:hypothetical protein [Agathobacter sp.]
MKRKWHRASFTVEAVIWIPILIFIIMTALRIGIGFFQESATREVYPELKKLDIVTEFYNYQIIGEIGKEIFDD